MRTTEAAVSTITKPRENMNFKIHLMEDLRASRYKRLGVVSSIIEAASIHI